MRLTQKQARKALDSLDDYARMDMGVDAYGPRGMLEQYIAQHDPVTAERLSAEAGVPVVLHAPEDVERAAQAMGNNEQEVTLDGALVAQMLRSYAALLRATV